MPRATDQTFEECPIGLWLFKLKDMEPGIQGNPEYGDKERVKWVFIAEKALDVDDPEPTRDNPSPKSAAEWIGEEVWGFTSLSMATKAVMRQWSEALLGREVGPDEDVKASDLIGKRAKATVGRGQTGRQKITSLMPYKPKAKPARVEDDDDETEGDGLPF